MKKMRTINDAYMEIVKKDPDSSIKKSAFRRLVNEGKIPCVYIGRKKLISMEDVFAFFDSDADETKKNPS